MKKKLIAIAVATASVTSGVANAESSWEVASTGGVIDIGGTITVDNKYDDLWQWTLGDAIELTNTDEDMNAEKDSLTITMDKRTPLLVGKSDAFQASGAGIGASPSISFSGADGVEVKLQNAETPQRGRAVLELPIKGGESNSVIGTLTLNVTTAGVMYKQSTNAQYGGPHPMVAPNAGDIFHGGLPASIGGLSGSTAVNMIAQDGGLTVNEMMHKWNQFTNQEKSWIQVTQPYSSKGTVAAVYGYSLAIDQGQTLKADFNSPLTSTTKWSAPLTISIAYN